MRWSFAVVLWLASMMAFAQESGMQAQLRREGERVADACHFSLKAVGSCAYTLFTDHPLHIAAGSLPPQNGFGLGAAFVASKNTTNWRLSWDLDALAATSGSWRAGGYMKLVHTPSVVIHAPVPNRDPHRAVGEENAHACRASLHRLQSLRANHLAEQAELLWPRQRDAAFRRHALWHDPDRRRCKCRKPVFEWPALRALNLSLNGEMNGRFVNIRGRQGDSTPSIETLYNDATAPGLASQPGFFQLGEGIRIKPVIADRFALNYLGNFQQFFAPSDSRNSFLRWAIDLNHTLYLYGYSQSATRNTDAVGPDHCAPGNEPCPPVSRSRNLNGSINVRLLLSESSHSATSAVPFYFQQTLGGSDIDSAMSLGSYRDYRFRAPNLLLLQESIEHSIWGPFGVKFTADQGRVALTHGDLGFSHLRHSYAGGLTLRAGGFPMVSMMFAWGGPEGHHNIFNMNTSLLGGSARPALD